MDVRLSAEQQALRDSAAQMVDRLGPHVVGELDDLERADKLDAAVALPAGASCAPRKTTARRGRRRRGRASSPRSSGADSPTPPSSDRRSPPSCGDWPARRRASAPETVAARRPPRGAWPRWSTASWWRSIAIDAQGARRRARARAPDRRVLARLGGRAASGASAPTSPARRPFPSRRLARWRCPTRHGCSPTTTLAALDRARPRAHVCRPRRHDARRGRPSPASTRRARASTASADRFVPGGAAPARRRARRRWRVRAASRCTRPGRSTRSTPADALAAGGGGQGLLLARAARDVCETAIQVHGGIGNTWECLAHVYLRRALLSIDVLGGVGPNLAPGARPPRDRRSPMDFADSPDEAEFRPRLRAWLADNNPGLPASSTDDEYWRGQAAWHQSLYDAGFFGMSWPARDRRPRPADASTTSSSTRSSPRPARRRGPSLGYLVAGHPRARQRRHQAALPARASSTDATAGARASASPMPAPTSRRCARGPIATATSTSSPGTRSGRATPTTPSGASCWPAPTTTCPSTRASPRSRCRCTSRASSSDRCKMINGITKEFGEVLFDGRACPPPNMIGAPGRGLARSR